MTVELIDKRRSGGQPGVGIANGTWFAILDLPGMEMLVDQQHTNDPLNVTPSKAKKMAAIVSDWQPPQTWGNDNVKVRNSLKATIIAFLLNCNGFRSR